MRAVILAAGQATRLRPLTDHCPKCLLEVGGEAILARTVRLLAARGVTRFTIVDGFCGDLIRRAVAEDFPGLDVTFVRNADYASTNNAWSLMLAGCRGDEPIMLLDSDILCEEGVYDAMLAPGAPNRLGLRTQGTIGDEEMKVRLDGRGQVAALTKRMPPAAAAGESVGIEVFGEEFVAALGPVLARRMRVDGLVNEYYEEAFTELAGLGHAILPVDLGPLRCLEIDTPEDLAEARRLFAAGEIV
ncbi:MAG TPA: phosphocholine cytidylyltransferase family protein [Candidatus Krumholzibacteria bacterium]|nr:phosphocholine cytidylyltransferase family protein [Candidatus Krumholzibacteria bacterium]